MTRLVNDVKNLMRSEIKTTIGRRIGEFEKVGRSSDAEIFKELCFCILTANFNAEKSIVIQENIDNGFLTLSLEELEHKLRVLGHRYPRARARYIVEARKYVYNLKNRLRAFSSSLKAREWLAENIKGIGYKEASHFLRNIGYKDLAIIDFHIADLLDRYGIIMKPKTITRKRYLEIEEVLRLIAKELGISLAELDLYLWYLETGRVLK
ncbi:MAG: N-glycosylase [Thermoproteota archaeon]|nr:MAG: N-glycosylase [Candidatus Korarchaeota archaeon]